MIDFSSSLRALVHGGVEFILVGGAAATVHGSSRLTQDVDVVYGRDDANLERLAAALAPFDPYPRGASKRGLAPIGSIPRRCCPSKLKSYASRPIREWGKVAGC